MKSNFDYITGKYGKFDNVDILVSHFGDAILLEGLSGNCHDFYVRHDNETRIGFTESYNELLLDCLSRNDSQYALLLNNDTELDPECVSNLYKFMEDNPHCGIAGCKIITMNDRDQIQHGGTGDCFPSGNHKVGLVSNNDLIVSTRERWVTGCALMLRLDMVRQIGILDNNYKLIFQDSDYCYTARSRGWEVWYCADATVYHVGGVSQGNNRTPEQQKTIQADFFKFGEKWIGSRLWNELNMEIF